MTIAHVIERIHPIRTQLEPYIPYFSFKFLVFCIEVPPLHSICRVSKYSVFLVPFGMPSHQLGIRFVGKQLLQMRDFRKIQNHVSMGVFYPHSSPIRHRYRYHQHCTCTVMHRKHDLLPSLHPCCKTTCSHFDKHVFSLPTPTGGQSNWRSTCF